MRGFLKNRRVLCLLAVVAVIVVAVLLLGRSGGEPLFFENVAEVILTPVQKVFSGIGNGVSEFFGYFSDIDELKKEIKSLKEENAELKADMREGEAAKSENDELRRILALGEANPLLETEAAEIIARSPSNWYSTITIDKGSADGIALNQPVISSGKSLVGRISRVGTTWAEITTVTDPEHSAGVEVVRSGDLGITEGDSGLELQGLCKLSFISKFSDIVVGDTIVTSGIGGIYPRGLLVGKVTEICPDIQGISRYALIKPEVDIDDLKQVLVVKNASAE